MAGISDAKKIDARKKFETVLCAAMSQAMNDGLELEDAFGVLIGATTMVVALGDAETRSYLVAVVLEKFKSAVNDAVAAMDENRKKGGSESATVSEQGRSH